MPSEDFFEDGRSARDGRGQTFRAFCAAFAIPPVITMPANWGVGPMDLGVILPTAAALTSVVTDGALAADAQLASIYAPAAGGTNTNQSIGLVIIGAELIITDGAFSVLASTVVDDLLAADPTLEWTAGGVTRARSLIGSLKTAIEVSNAIDSDQAAPTAFARRLSPGSPLVIPTMNICPKAGDTLGIRTRGTLTATINCRLRLHGAFLPADELDLMGPHQGQGGSCNAGRGLSADITALKVSSAQVLGQSWASMQALRSQQ